MLPDAAHQQLLLLLPTLLPSTMTVPDPDDFYVRYYSGQRDGRFGHEFLEFELYPSGKLRYANNFDSMIRREVTVSPAVVEEFRRIVQVSDIAHVDDSSWPSEEAGGSREELECKIGPLHLAFATPEVRSMAEIRRSLDPSGLQIFYRLVQDLKALVWALISIHFKERPI